MLQFALLPPEPAAGEARPNEPAYPNRVACGTPEPERRAEAEAEAERRAEAEAEPEAKYAEST